MADTIGGARDSIFLGTGAWAFNGSGNIDVDSCDKEDPTENEELNLKLPGCAKFEGTDDGEIGVFRTLQNVNVHQYDTLQFNLISNNKVKICLESQVDKKWSYFCQAVESTKGANQLTRVKISDFFGGSEPSRADLAGVGAVNFIIEDSGKKKISISDMHLLKLGYEWTLVTIENEEMRKNPALNFNEVKYESLILWELDKNGKWACWSPKYNLKQLVNDFGANCQSTLSSFKLGSSYWASSRVKFHTFGNSCDLPEVDYKNLATGWNMVTIEEGMSDIVKAVNSFNKPSAKAYVASIWSLVNGQWHVWTHNGTEPTNTVRLESLEPGSGYFIEVKDK